MGEPLLPALRDELLALLAEDQELSLRYFEATRHDPALRAKFAFQLAPEERPAIHDELVASSRRHAGRLAEIVRDHGWPGRTLVGDDGAMAAWAVLQHADDDNGRRKELLPLLERAVRNGEADAQHLAALTDRVLMVDGQLQRYGTVPRAGDGGDHWELGDVEDPDGLDERRAAIGLPPWSDYQATLGAPSTWYGDGGDDDGGGG